MRGGYAVVILALVGGVACGDSESEGGSTGGASAKDAGAGGGTGASSGSGGSGNAGTGGSAGTTTGGAGSGGASASGGSGGTGATGGATGGSAGASGGSGGGAPTQCPPLPKDGDACATENLTCSYGNDYDPACRTVAVCSGAKFKVCQPTCKNPGLACPSSPPQNGGSCSKVGACGYSDGIGCVCTDCVCPCTSGTVSPMWICIGTASGCPASLPNAGDLCSIPGKKCYYGPGCHGFGATCTDGAWQWDEVSCG